MYVSVIVPTFNEEKNIARLLVSIKKQTFKNIEIVVVDDGSKDKTVEISQKYTKKVYKRKHTERSIQRNFGATKSQGKYLLFLDADMELTSKVIESCANLANKNKEIKAITIAEKTVGNNFIAKIRNFEREMYMGDASIEVPRFFERRVFFEFRGYDPKLTGPEDFDLPYRISKKYSTGRVEQYILHHEENTTLIKLLKKKYYYAAKGAYYAKKHPELVRTQGNLLFRSAYYKNWKKFIANPLIGISFIIVRILETCWAVAGFISSVGLIGFLKVALNINNEKN